MVVYLDPRGLRGCAEVLGNFPWEAGQRSRALWLTWLRSHGCVLFRLWGIGFRVSGFQSLGLR